MGKVLRGIDPSAPVQTVYPGRAGGQITVAALADLSIDKHDVTHNVRLTYRSCLNSYIIPEFGARPIGDVATGGSPDSAGLALGSGHSYAPVVTMMPSARARQERVIRILLIVGLAPGPPLAAWCIWQFGYAAHPQRIVYWWIVAPCVVAGNCAVQWFLYRVRMRQASKMP